MKNLSPVQFDTLCVIERALRERGYSPTVREISAARGVIGIAGTASTLDALERKGYLSRSGTHARNLHLHTVPIFSARGIIGFTVPGRPPAEEVA